MIVSANENKDFLSIVNSLAENNPFACRIISLYNSYKPELAFVDYWLEINEEGLCCSAIARNGTAFILCITNKSDIDEISSFMRVAGASNVICDAEYKLDLFGMRCSTGSILMKNTLYDDFDDIVDIREPDIKSAYQLLMRCSNESFTPPAFDDFYVDVNHKLRHKTMRMCGIYFDDMLCSVGMTVAESDDGAVLGAIACDPDLRKQGYGSYVVKYLTNMLLSENKTVYLHRAENENVSFYNNLGFEEIGKWCEYKSEIY